MTIKTDYEQAHARAKSFIEGVLAKADAGTYVVTDEDSKEAHRLADEALKQKGRLERQKALEHLTTGLTGVDETVPTWRTDDDDNWGAQFGGQQFLEHNEGDFTRTVVNEYSPKSAAKASAWSVHLVKQIKARDRALGSKSILGSTMELPTPVLAPVPLQDTPTNILEIIPTVQMSVDSRTTSFGGGNTFTVPVQKTRENRATSVPDRGLKPTSGYSWGETSGRLRVIAHLSEDIPERFLEDYGQLVSLLQAEMFSGLLKALEEDVLNGPVDGVAPAGTDPFTGILNTSGIRTVVPEAGDDVLRVLSNGVDTLTDAGDTPTAWLMHPRDLRETLLLRENGTIGPLLFNTGRTALEQYTGGAKIITSNRIARGTALVGNFQQCTLFVRNGATMRVDRSGDRFEHNLVKFLVEGRYGFVVQRPASFVKVTLPQA